MEFFTTPNSKNIIATLRIVTIEKSELTFVIIFPWFLLISVSLRSLMYFSRKFFSSVLFAILDI